MSVSLDVNGLIASQSVVFYFEQFSHELSLLCTFAGHDTHIHRLDLLNTTLVFKLILNYTYNI